MKIQEVLAVVRKLFVLSRKVERRRKAERRRKGVATIPVKANVASTTRTGLVSVMNNAFNMATAVEMFATFVEFAMGKRLMHAGTVFNIPGAST